MAKKKKSESLSLEDRVAAIERWIIANDLPTKKTIEQQIMGLKKKEQDDG